MVKWNMLKESQCAILYDGNRKASPILLLFGRHSAEMYMTLTLAIGMTQGQMQI